MTEITDPLVNTDTVGQSKPLDIADRVAEQSTTPRGASDYQMELSERIHVRVCAGLDPGAHGVLAQILDTLTDLDSSTNPQIARNLEVAVAALEREPPEVELASRIVVDSHRLLGIRRRRARPNYSPGVLIVMGLCTLVYGLSPLVFIGYNLVEPLLGVNVIMGIPVYFVLLIAFAGALGSGVSILVRIGEFSHLTQTDPYVLFLIGFFKPVIGMSFALFVFAVIQAEIVPVSLPDEVKRNFFTLAVAFLAGFSERFAKDVVRRTEGVVGGS